MKTFAQFLEVRDERWERQVADMNPAHGKIPTTKEVEYVGLDITSPLSADKTLVFRKNGVKKVDGNSIEKIKKLGEREYSVTTVADTTYNFTLTPDQEVDFLNKTKDEIENI